jgi:hypothetical protein
MSTVTLNRLGPSRTLGRFCLHGCIGPAVARTAIKAGLIVLVLLMSLADAVAAGAFDDGQAAYDRGDHATALRLWRPLADQGDAAAQSRLGAMYASGTGVQQDNGVAATWYRRAADQGLASSQYNLGVMYDRGRGLPQSYTAAVAWFRKAADQSHPDAQYNLGVMYADGRGGLRQSDPTICLVFAGDPKRGVPPCAACHGPGAHKLGAPALQGQHAAYIERQLAAFAQGIRQNDINCPRHTAE